MSVAELTVAVQTLLALAAFANQRGDIWAETGSVMIPELVKLRKLVGPEFATVDGSALTHTFPQHQIQFKRIKYAYPEQGTPVFEAFDLTVMARTSLAIVGLNGAGKTTLVKLLTGLCSPDRGSVLLDGTDMRQINIDAWRRQVAVVFQDFSRYELSVRDNIAFGAIESSRDSALDTRILEACERANAKEIVDRLPGGLDTILSRRFPGGVDLSGGEWQRIALARALFATAGGAQVLILDEPTAHLDARMEIELFDRFLDITQGLTTILISHRFSTVRRADRIVVLEDGLVVEDGNHEQLLGQDGRYARMFHLQAVRYTSEASDG